MDENIGVAVAITSPSVSVQNLFHFRFPLPVSWPTLMFPMSVNVGLCRQCHILVRRGRKYRGSRWNRFAICFRSKVISTSGFNFRFRCRHLSFRCLPTSDRVGSVISKSGMDENIGVAVAIASLSVSVQNLFYFRFPLPVSWPTLEFPMSANVWLCRQCHIRIGHGRKYGGSRWNRFAICLRSNVISTSGFRFRLRGRHLRFRCRPTLGRVGSVIFGSGIVENVGVAVGIASPSVSVQKLFPLPVSWPTF